MSQDDIDALFGSWSNGNILRLEALSVLFEVGAEQVVVLRLGIRCHFVR